MRIQIIMVITVVVVSLLADAYIYLYLRKTRHSRTTQIAYLIGTAICYAAVIVGLCLPTREGSSSILPVMWIFYAYLTVYAAKIAFIIMTLLAMLPRLWGSRVNLGVATGLPVAIAVFLIMWWGAIWGRREIQVNYYNEVSPKIPAAFNGYRIVQFSDLHVGTWGTDTTFVSELVDSINALKPDVILFTGDIVNRNSQELKPFVNVLSRLRARDGVYSILGNHDYGDYQNWATEQDYNENKKELLRMQKQMGWKMLNNQHTFLIRGNDTIPLIGMENWGEPPFTTYGDLDKSYPREKENRYHQRDTLFKILMTHNPEFWNQKMKSQSNIDLTLSGHTHAMQMIVKVGDWRWSPAQYKYEQWGGDYHRLNDRGEPMTIYTNIGSGEVGLPYRIGAPPEITVITLYSRNAGK